MTNKYSLSWFKKRTAQINRELRGGRKKGVATFSPRAEYKKQQAYAARGDVSPFVRRYGGGGDFRSASGSAAISSGVSLTLIDIWEPFAMANKSARAILDHLGEPGLLINTNTGAIYRVTADKKGNKHYTRLLDHGQEAPIKGRPPASLKNLSNETAAVALAKKAKDVKRRTARTSKDGGGGALGGYQDL